MIAWLTANWWKLVLSVVGVLLLVCGMWATVAYVRSHPSVEPAARATDTGAKSPRSEEAVAGETDPPATAPRTGGDIAASEADLRGALTDQRRAGVDEGLSEKGIRRMNREELNDLGDQAWKEYRTGKKTPRRTPRTDEEVEEPSVRPSA